MAFIQVTFPAYFCGPTADRTAQLEECAIGSVWFDDDDGIEYHKTNAGTWKAATTGSVSLGGSLPAGTNVIGKTGIDNTTPGTTNGVVINAPVATTNTTTPDTDFGTVTKKSVKASAGNLYYISCSNKNAALRWLQLHNKASAPAGGDVPVESWPVPAGSANVPGFFGIGTAELGVAGRRCSTGVAWAISTTQATFTDAATAADHGVDMAYL